MEELAKIFADLENGKVMITHGKDHADIMVRAMDYVRQILPEARMTAKMANGTTSWTIAM